MQCQGPLYQLVKSGYGEMITFTFDRNTLYYARR